MIKAACLISTGLDSPVAAYMIMRSNIIPIFIHFTKTSPSNKDKIEKIHQIIVKIKEYCAYRGDVLTYTVDQNAILEEVAKHCPRNLTCLICRRLMFRIGSRLASLGGGSMIVTGEILGTHASQTLENIYVENSVSMEVPVVRPLIGLNKLDLEAITKEMGTYHIAAESSIPCPWVPAKPRTAAKHSEVETVEKYLNINILVENSLKGAKKFWI